MHSLLHWLRPLLLLLALPVLARDYRFDGSMPEEVLRSYLSRSMTTMYLLTGHGDFDDNLRMLTNCGVKFAGRAVYQWGREEGGESALPKKLEMAKKNAARIHAADAAMMLQACIFEIEFDNYGRSRKPGEAGMGKFWVWGWDEITWFSQQPENYRNEWLRYAWRWVREHDPAGYVQMPGLRCLAGAADGKRWYDVNQPSTATPNGFGQEETIRKIWASDD